MEACGCRPGRGSLGPASSEAGSPEGQKGKEERRVGESRRVGVRCSISGAWRPEELAEAAFLFARSSSGSGPGPGPPVPVEGRSLGP